MINISKEEQGSSISIIDYAQKGYSYAKRLKNEKYEKIFKTYISQKHIILIRHCESEKNINKTINGIGKLTDYGKQIMTKKGLMIKNYLAIHGIYDTEIKLYGYQNTQTEESLFLLSGILPGAETVYDERLAPTNMGVLKSQNEADVISSEAYIELERWRNRQIPVNKLSIEDMEKPKDFWLRAVPFIEAIIGNKCSIVVCTTSIAILLTHILLKNNYDTDTYMCIDVPLGGMIHFIDDGDGYVLHNRDLLTNIAFQRLDPAEGDTCLQEEDV